MTDEDRQLAVINDLAQKAAIDAYAAVSRTAKLVEGNDKLAVLMMAVGNMAGSVCYASAKTPGDSNLGCHVAAIILGSALGGIAKASIESGDEDQLRETLRDLREIIDGTEKELNNG